jgi:hypothetical protein
MTSTPILVTGGATPDDPGQTVIGTASNKHQTDSYLVVGNNNTITENGGNLDINQAAFLGGTEPRNPNTTVVLGNATGVTDMIDLGYGPETVMQAPGTALTRSVVNVVLWGGSATVSLVNQGGTNDINLLESSNDTVTLSGAMNIVQGGLYSTIRLNGNATNTVTPLGANVFIGSADDDLFGYSAKILLGPDSTNSVTAGDENVVVTGTTDLGGNTITLGDGNNTVNLSGGDNRVTVGAGNNVINPGALGVSTVTILARDASDARVPRHATDTVTLFGSENTVTAADENVTILGTLDTGTNTISLGDGNNTITLRGAYDFVTVGDGRNTITLSGSNDRVTVNDPTGRGSEQISLGAGTADRVTLGMAGGTITDTGAGTTTISQSVSATAAVHVTLSAEGIVTLGNGRDMVTVGANSTVTVGDGNDTLSLGQGSTLLAGAGQDTITLGDHDRLGVTGSATSRAVIQLGNDDDIGITGGRVVTTDSVGNDTIQLDDVSSGSTINFTNLDDVVALGLNSSARVFLNPGGGDAMLIQATDGTGSYSGKIDVTGFGNDILYLASLVGGNVAEPLNSYAAVLDNITHAGSQQILSLQGGGQVVFHGNVQLQASQFAFITGVGPVVPPNL